SRYCLLERDSSRLRNPNTSPLRNTVGPNICTPRVLQRTVYGRVTRSYQRRLKRFSRISVFLAVLIRICRPLVVNSLGTLSSISSHGRGKSLAFSIARERFTSSPNRTRCSLNCL